MIRPHNLAHLMLIAAGTGLLAAALAPARGNVSPPRAEDPGRCAGAWQPEGGSSPATHPTPPPAPGVRPPPLSAPRPLRGSPVPQGEGSRPIAFEPNRGQTDRRVEFLARGAGYSLFLTGDEAVLRLNEPRRHPPASRVPGTERNKYSGNQLRQAGAHRTERRSETNLSPSQSGSTPCLRDSVVKLRLLGANPHARVAGEAPLPGRSNYFRGNDPAKWRTNVPQYARVRYEAVYPGIDLVYYGNQEGRLEYDFEVAPGADPKKIRLAVSGARRVEMAPSGDLLLHTAAGTLRQHRPIAYQVVEGERRPVAASYALVRPGIGSSVPSSRSQDRQAVNDLPTHAKAPERAWGRALFGGPFMGVPMDRQVLQGLPDSSTRPHLHTSTQVRFKLGAYDPTLPLVIDPVLSYSTYLGGSQHDPATGIAVDGAGAAYVTGVTESADFPTTTGVLDRSLGGSADVFVAKLDPTGSTLVYATYLGGSAEDGGTSGWAADIAVDAAGNAYVTATTESDDFPTVNPFQATRGVRRDAFVTKIDPSGSALLYSTYLGGSSQDNGRQIAVDAAGSACVAGTAHSDDFPIANALQATMNGNWDGFVAKLSPAGSSLLFSTYLGGSGPDTITGLALDGAGNIQLAGLTASINLPTTAGAIQLNQPDLDAFATKLNAAGTAFIYSTYLGGSGVEQGYGVAADAAGNAWVVGQTNSPNYPTVNALQPALAGGNDAFVTKINPTGTALAYSTYLGGSDSELAFHVAADAGGSAWIAGATSSANFPLVDPLQPTIGSAGVDDGFLARLNPAGSALTFSTYLGGSAGDELHALALDAAGAAYLGGLTGSTDFPVVNPAQPGNGGMLDAVVAKITVDPPPAPPPAPANLTATAVSQMRIDLAWGDNSDNEAGFRVERWNGSAFAPIATVGANVITYSNTGLTGATTYRYRVIAFNAGGDSAPSNTAEATTLPNPPAAPSNLVATALSQTEIRLTWNENASNEDAIEVWRSTGGPFALHAGLGPNQTSYLDQNLTANTLYVYQARAVNQGGNSAFSNQAGATTLPNPPAAPSGLTATAVSGSQINLAWGDNSTNEVEFVLEVSSDGGTTFAFLATRAENTTTYSHTGLTPETTRHYRVKARNAGGDSGYSNIAFATTPQVPPAAPTNLTATALSSSEIRLSWNDVSSEQGYRIERRQGNDPFAFLAEVGSNTTTYTDSGLAANTLYVYRVQALNAAGSSGWSNEASARTAQAAPAAPSGLTATAVSATQVDLAWTDESGNELGFILERSENAGASWSQVASLPANVTLASDTGAQGGRNYQYRLKAWNDVGQSDPSNVASVTTPAAVALASLTVTPTAVRGRRNATGKVTLTGAAPSGGVSVTLSSSNVAASVPSSVTVPAGATEATFTVTTSRVRRNTRVTLTATLAAVQKTAVLTVRK